MYESSPTETNQKKDEKEQIMKKIRQLENQQKILLNRQSDMERRARTRRRKGRCRTCASSGRHGRRRCRGEHRGGIRPVLECSDRVTTDP